MTLGDLLQACYDVLGFTGQTTLMTRLVNEAQQDVATFTKWPWAEASATISFTGAQSTIGLPADCAFVSELTNSVGTPADKLHEDTFRDLYRGDATTGAYPKVFCAMGPYTNTGTPSLYIWPIPITNGTGTVYYFKRFADLSATTDPCRIPAEHHRLVVDCAVARFRQWEGDEAQSQAAWQTALTNLKLAANRESTDAPGDQS